MILNPKKLAARGISSVLSAALLMASPGYGAYAAAAQTARASGWAAQGTARGPGFVPHIQRVSDLGGLGGLLGLGPISLGPLARTLGAEPLSGRPSFSSLGLGIRHAARAESLQRTSPSTTRPEAPEKDEASSSLRDAAADAAVIQSGVLSEDDDWSSADFTAGRQDGPDVAVFAASWPRAVLGGLSRSNQFRRQSAAGGFGPSPMFQAQRGELRTSARGQLAWAAVSGKVSAVLALTGHQALSGTILGFSAPWLAAAAVPVLTAAAFIGLAGLGYAVLGGRIAAVVWRHVSKLPDGVEEDEPHAQPWLERLGLALRVPIATSEADHPALEQLAPQAKALVVRHEQSHRAGHGEFYAYMKQALGHPAYLGREAWAAGRATLRGARAFLDLGRRMAVGDADMAGLVRPHKKAFVAAMILSVLDAVLNNGISLFISPLLGLGGGAGGAVLLWVYSSAILGGFALYVVVELLFNIKSGSLGMLAARDFRDAFVSNLLRQTMSFFLKKANSSSNLANRAKLDVTYLANKNVGLRVTLPHYLLYLAFGVAAGVWVYAYYGLPLYLIAPIFAVMPVIGVLSVVIGKKINRLGLRQADLKAELLRHAQETFRLMALIRSSGAENFEARRYEEKSAAVERNERAMLSKSVNFSVFVDIFGNLPVQMIYLVGGLAVVAMSAHGALAVGTIVQLVFIAGFIKYSFVGLASKYLNFKEAEGKSEDARRLMLREPEMADAAGAAPVSAPVGVRFENVTFHYPAEDGQEPVRVLDGLDFEVRPGETHAFVGETGSGKSTIASLILRLWDADQGRVLVNGRDVRESDSSSLRRRIAVVDQGSALFGGTVRENMTYGSGDVPEERLAEAIRLAKADFIFDESRFPKGLETDVSEAGGRLSGGERQRVAIVRALLRRCSLLILDEATSALDNQSERAVQDAIESLPERPTKIIIAHRLTTVRNADRIHVLSRGRIVESGTHGELLALGGTYARLWREGRYGAETSAARQLGAGAAALSLAGGALASPFLALGAGVPFAAKIAAGLLLAGAPALAGLAFLIAGVRVARAVAQRLSSIEAEGPRGPTWLRRFARALLDPIAAAVGNAPAYDLLPQRIRAFIDLHENAHRERGAGEIRASAAQLRGVAALLRGELRVARIAARRFLRLMKTFLLGDEGVRALLARFKGHYRLAVGLVAINAVLGIALSQLIGKFLDAAVLASAAGFAPCAVTLYALAGVVVALSIINPWLGRWGRMIVGNLTITLTWKLRFLLFEKLLHRDMSFYREEGNESSALASRLADDVDKLASKNVGIRLPLMQYLVTLVLGGALMIYTSPVMALSMAMLPILGKIGGKLAQKADKVSEEYSSARANMVSDVQGLFERARLVKSFGQEKAEAGRVYGVLDRLAAIGVKMSILDAKAFLFRSSLADLFTKYLVYILGVAFGLPVGQIVAMVFLAGFVQEAFSGISENWMAFRQAQGETRVVRQWLGREREAADAPGARPLPPGPVGIRFENVGFQYRSGDNAAPVLDNVSFEAKPGETVAIVGESGSGKSTVLGLAQRLMDPGSGRVLANGRDLLKEVTRESYIGRIAVVSQEAPVFDDTIEFNLRFGAPPDLSEEEFMAAVRSAAPFVLDAKMFPEGLKTRVGEGGSQLSGGQRQRVAIVRAMLRRPRLLILDEATSALDKNTEREIQAVLANLASGQGGAGKPTILVVAHNLTTIMNSDRILVMDKGRIVASGTHQELLDQGGVYKRLWDASLKNKRD